MSSSQIVARRENSRLLRPKLPRTVVALGFVSLLTDLSSDMIVPLLPVFVATLGAGPAFLGMLEGVAQAIVAALKLIAGRLSDRTRRKPWIVFGYGLSALARPLLALAQTPAAVLAVRSADRVGKGMRGSPRDALVADVTPVDLRGRAFGLQRAMDHCGALLGALVAFALLQFGCTVRGVFAWAALPAGVALLVLVVAVREVPRRRLPPAPRSAPNAGAPTDARLRRYLAVVAFAVLGTFPELLLVQRALDLGVAPSRVLLLWAALHVVRAGLAAPLGAMSDRIGRRGVIATGHAASAVVLLGFAVADSPWQAWLCFGAHGMHAAFTEGAERAFVADLAGPAARGRAFGMFHIVSGAAAIPAGWLLGSLYEYRGASVALCTAALLSAVAAAVLWLVVRPAPGNR